MHVGRCVAVLRVDAWVLGFVKRAILNPRAAARQRVGAVQCPPDGPDGLARLPSTSARLQDHSRDLAADLASLMAVHAISTRLLGAGDLHAVLREILAAAAQTTRTDKGSIQFFEPSANTLRIVVQQGHGEGYVERFGEGICSVAASVLRARQRVIVEDVTREAAIARRDELEALIADDIRAIQCTPLISRSGRVLGLLNTHFRAPSRPPEQVLRFLDLLARMAADIIERSFAENALRESEERYRSLFESIDDGLCVIELTREGEGGGYRLVDCNPSFARHMRRPGGPAHAQVPQIDPSWISACRTVSQTGRSMNFEHRHPALDAWYEVNAFRLGPPGDHRVAVLFRDITQRRSGEIRDRFRLALDEALRAPLDAREAKRRAARVLGEHLRAHRVAYAELDEDRAWATIDECYADGVASADGNHPTHACGALMDRLRAGRAWINGDIQADAALNAVQKSAFARQGVGAAIIVPFVEGGRLAGVLAVHQATARAWTEDEVALVRETAQRSWHAAERARAEAALRESEAKFRDLADNISQFAWMADADGSVFWYNRRWFEYTGSDPESARGRGWRRFVHPDQLEQVERRMARYIDGGSGQWEDSFALRARDGSYRWFLARAMPIRDAQGRVVRWFGTHTDIDDQRNAEQALREADRRKDEFLAVLGHELRTPLAPIRNAVEILRNAALDEAQASAARDMIDRQVRQMVRLIDDLLDIGRITTDRIRLRTERVELAAILEQAVETVRGELDAAGHELVVRAPTDAIRLDADPARLVQVFANLLGNACKYTGPGGRIELDVERGHDPSQGACVVVRVKDNGIGMPAEFLPKLFMHFSQARPALEHSQGGLGIGLALVRRLVEMHEGRISGRSDGPGRGSEFVVTLPVIEDEAAVTLAPGPLRPVPLDAQGAQAGGDARQRAAGPPRRRTLVVDDSHDCAESLAILLRLHGDEVELAHDGLEALEVAGRVRPHVVLLDIGLPKLNGYDTCRALRAQQWGRDMLVIAQTGWGQDEDRERAMRAGFDAHLVKPIDCAALMQVLESLSKRAGGGLGSLAN